MVYAHTSDRFETAWNELQNVYYVEYFDIIDYLTDTWIRPYARKIVKCYTNKIRHFFSTTTSRSEGAHRVLKNQLGVSTGDLKLVVENIEMLLLNQRKEYAIKLDSAKMRVPFDLQIPLFRGIISAVTPYAMRMIYNQYKLIDTPDWSPNCTHSWSRVAGLPCSHIIKIRMESSERILFISDIHPHWRYVKPPIDDALTLIIDSINPTIATASMITIDPILLIQEPAVARTRGRPVGTTIEPPSQRDIGMKELIEENVSGSAPIPTESLSQREQQEEISTQRNPSQFEIVEGIVPERQPAFIRGMVATRGLRRSTRRGKGKRKQRDGEEEEQLNAADERQRDVGDEGQLIEEERSQRGARRGARRGEKRG